MLVHPNQHSLCSLAVNMAIPAERATDAEAWQIRRNPL